MERTIEQIRVEASKIGIHVIKSTKYSEEENIILRKYYPVEGLSVIKRLSNRTSRSILQQALKLRIKSLGEKKVLCVEMNKIFDSINEASIYCGFKDGSSIYKALNGERKTAGCCHWKYVEEGDKEYV